MKNETSLIFTGDIGFDKYMDKKWEDENLLAPEVQEFLKNTDHLIINVEGPLAKKKNLAGDMPGSRSIPTVSSAPKETAAQTAAGTPNGKATQLLHTMDADATKFFNKIGADVWNICNNHIMDAGPDGMASTLKEAARCKVLTLGAGMNIEEASRPVIFNEAGGIGMVGVGYQRACRKADKDVPGCLSWSDMERIKQAIDEIKKTCRWCIVVAHGGEEFTALPSPYTRDRYIEYLNMGADIVVSHHPHVPMNYETFPDKAIFYSLGNFIFDTDYQRSQFNTEKGIFIKLKFTEEEFSFEPFGIEIDRNDERIVGAELPKIFVDVQQEEYEKLAPLAAKMFIRNTKRQQIYMKPDKYSESTTEEEWKENFYEPLRSGRVPGEVLDMQIVYPLSLEADKEAWKMSKLEGVKEYMLEQL